MDAPLRQAIVDWISARTGAEVVQLERAPARREAWRVDVADRAGAPTRYFLRLGREGDPANDPESVAREAEITRVLGARGLRLPEWIGAERRLGAALYERVAGRSDLENVPADQQQAVYRDYLVQLAELHRLELEPAEVGASGRPQNAAQCALIELANVEATFAPKSCEPLATFGLQWLRRHVPHRVDRIAFVHGDAGTPNFMFEGDAVTALIDWEWAHFGDPMEDLGNAAIHASFHPSGDWPELLDVYERASGVAVDLDRVRYYRAHLMVRSVLALAAATATWDPHVPVALNLCFRVTSDRICCDSIAEAMGIELERPEVPRVAAASTTLYDVVVENLARDVRPLIGDEFARERLDAAGRLVLGLEREHRIGPALAEIELDELGRLLGHRPPDLATGLATLDREIPRFGADREVEVLRYLGRRAWRAEQLWAPVVAPFAGRELRPLVRSS